MTRMEHALRMVAAVVFRIPQGRHRSTPSAPVIDDDAPTVSFARLAHPYKQETR